jgi:sulfur-carrier protein adenylyltransferase/sulfurtransferase
MDFTEVLSRNEIMPFEVKALLEARDNNELEFLLVDIREPYEYDHARIKGCDYLMPTSQFQNHLSQLKAWDKEGKKVIMYCRTAHRTADILEILQSMKFEHIAHMKFGIMSYGGEVLFGKNP